MECLIRMSRWILNIRYSNYVEVIVKKHGENIDNPSIRIYVNKIENRITLAIKAGYYLELLTPETKALNVKYLKILLIQHDYQHNSTVYIPLFQICHLVVY